MSHKEDYLQKVTKWWLKYKGILFNTTSDKYNVIYLVLELIAN